MIAGMIFCGPLMAQQQLQDSESRVQSKSDYAPDEIVVKFLPGVSTDVITEINTRHGSSILSSSSSGGFKRLKVPKGKTVEEMVAIYQHNPNVDYAEPNFMAYAADAPDDEYYSFQWHMDNSAFGGIHLNEARTIETGRSDVIVAVIDTGVAYEDYTDPGIPIGKSGKYIGGSVFAQAPDLAVTNFVQGWDFVNSDDHPNDDEGHGTHVTGTIAQSTDNGIGVAGIAPGCSIMPIKVLDSSGSGTYTAIAEGIYYAADNGASVINMSLGGASPSSALEQALSHAYEAGVTIVCASGNDSAGTVSYPAAYDAYCIAVGATRYDETVAYYSNTGDSLDLTAPGGDTTVDQNDDSYSDGVLQQTHNGSDYTTFSYYFYQGTSMATPHVAGVAALVISQGVRNGRPLSPAEVREALQASAEDKGSTGWDSDFGFGIVDAHAALNYYSYGTDTNHAPVAHAGGEYSGDEGAEITFDGSGSIDPDGDSLTYLWNFGDGASGSGSAPVHTYDAGGTYTATLVVNDGKTDSDPSTATVVITEINDPPVADAGPDQEALTGEAVAFDGEGSYDEEGSPLAYDWDFDGDGIIDSHEVKPVFTYSEAGVYTVSLVVNDGELSSTTDTALITISDPVQAQGLSVTSIDMYLKTSGINTGAKAIVTVVSSVDQTPVSGVAVSGDWTGATQDSDSGITDTNGQVSLVSDNVKRAGSGTTYTFTVSGAVLEGWVYEPENSSETSDSVTVP